MAIICSLFTVFCLLFITRMASAHAQLVAAEPAIGASLRDSPAEIHLTFNENLGESSAVTVIGENFLRVADVEVREVALNEIFVTVPQLEPGVYTVQYDVVSADGHPISGSYEFAVERNLSILWTIVKPTLFIGVILTVISYFGRSRTTPTFWESS